MAAVRGGSAAFSSCGRECDRLPRCRRGAVGFQEPKQSAVALHGPLAAQPASIRGQSALASRAPWCARRLISCGARTCQHRARHQLEQRQVAPARLRTSRAPLLFSSPSRSDTARPPVVLTLSVKTASTSAERADELLTDRAGPLLCECLLAVSSKGSCSCRGDWRPVLS